MKVVLFLHETITRSPRRTPGQTGQLLLFASRYPPCSYHRIQNPTRKPRWAVEVYHDTRSSRRMLAFWELMGRQAIGRAAVAFVFPGEHLQRIRRAGGFDASRSPAAEVGSGVEMSTACTGNVVRRRTQLISLRSLEHIQYSRSNPKPPKDSGSTQAGFSSILSVSS